MLGLAEDAPLDATHIADEVTELVRARPAAPEARLPFWPSPDPEKGPRICCPTCFMSMTAA